MLRSSLFSALTLCSLFSLAQLSAEETVDYRRDIKPLLSDRCYACHGPDANQRKGDLRLDLREEAIISAIEPGHPEKSELIARVTSDDPDLLMPSPKSNKPRLTAEEVELIRRWIKQGADFQQHWSYVPVERPQVPAAGEGWAANDVDRFLARKHAEQKVHPAPPADRRVLLRRLYFDLTGLPPTHAEVEAFAADESPDAYEKMVDKLLASERYGERMAQHWLDLVRYADTNGIHGDNHRDHGPYRDYVIKAFNENRPFDQFTREQLAGDLVAGASDELKVASGYNRLNMTTREGGAQPKEYMAKYAADRVRNAATVWLGATLECAECHDHKFDPFSTKDFYRFASFFADIQETAVGEQKPVKLPSPLAGDTAQIDARIAEIQKLQSQSTPEIAASQQKWEAEILSTEIQWLPVTRLEGKSEQGATFTIGEDGIVSVKEKSPATDVYRLSLKEIPAGVTGLRLDVLAGDGLPVRGPGQAGNGNFVLNEFVIISGEKKIGVKQATATHSQDSWPVAASVDGNAKSGWAILPQVGKNNHAVYELSESPAAGDLAIELSFQYGSSHSLGRFSLSYTTSEKKPITVEGQGIDPAILAILAVEREKRTPQQAEQLAAFYRTIAPQLSELRKELVELEKKRSVHVQSILIAQAGAPREMRVLPRGNWLDDSGEVVQPGVPAFLGEIEKEGRANRADLANWLVDGKNPLVARVFMNRLWKLCFGAGLSPSLEDLGSQGSSPSHPELLDWLADEFTAGGWNIKQMHKLLVMSSAYRQSSLASDEMKKLDPANRWLTRQRRFRLDAEMIRDNALAASGLLVNELGGASVKPYQPAGYWKHLNFPQREWKNDSGEALYRRGLYTYWCRTFLHPSLLAFDAPSREACCVQRGQSNTPQQALVLLNDPTYVEAARVLAEHALAIEAKEESARLAYLFQQALQRNPTPQEANILLPLLEKHRTEFAADPAAAAKYIQQGASPKTKGMDAAEFAAWTSLSRVVLNLHETITRY